MLEGDVGQFGLSKLWFVILISKRYKDYALQSNV
jgi:hypothetical protein